MGKCKLCSSVAAKQPGFPIPDLQTEKREREREKNGLWDVK